MLKARLQQRWKRRVGFKQESTEDIGQPLYVMDIKKSKEFVKMEKQLFSHRVSKKKTIFKFLIMFGTKSRVRVKKWIEHTRDEIKKIDLETLLGKFKNDQELNLKDRKLRSFAGKFISVSS